MLIQGDVFRPPRAGMFLPVCVGMGIQIGLTYQTAIGCSLKTFSVIRCCSVKGI